MVISIRLLVCLFTDRTRQHPRLLAAAAADAMAMVTVTVTVVATVAATVSLLRSRCYGRCCCHCCCCCCLLPTDLLPRAHSLRRVELLFPSTSSNGSETFRIQSTSCLPPVFVRPPQGQ